MARVGARHGSGAIMLDREGVRPRPPLFQQHCTHVVRSPFRKEPKVCRLHGALPHSAPAFGFISGTALAFRQRWLRGRQGPAASWPAASRSRAGCAAAGEAGVRDVRSWEEAVAGWQRPSPAPNPNKEVLDFAAQLVIFVLPFLGPAFAYFQWAKVLFVADILLGDEGQLEDLLKATLTPVTNGVVISCLAIAFGTLTSNTITTLRLRQKEVKQYLDKECCEISLLHSALQANLAQGGEGAEGGGELALYLQCVELLRLYSARIYSESTSEADYEALQRQSLYDSEVAGISKVLRRRSGLPTFSSMTVRDQVLMSLTRLSSFRSERLGTLTTAFPLSHWVILALLASLIGVCLIIEVDQAAGPNTKDSLALRLLFTFLIFAFCVLTSLCAELNEPFRGMFNVGASARQLLPLQELLGLEAKRVRGTLMPKQADGPSGE